jgi:flavin reductase (DIM6/NTAB) family NADH-FMN oxidoreductase RutF
VIKASGKMNVNCLTTEAPFKVFEAFGFKSGRDTDKFEGCTPKRSENGLVYLPHYINAYFSLAVESYVDLGSHGMFICSVTEAETKSSSESMTYSYYHANVKPKPKKAEASGDKKRYVCTVCGFIHEGELPEEYECPLCKHGREAFEEIK